MRSITLSSVIAIIKMLVDIGVVWVVFYYALKIVRNNARTSQIFKGILVLLLVKAIASFFGLSTIKYLVDLCVNYGFLAVIIIFQPEIRALLEKLGQSNALSRMTTLSGNELNDLVNALVDASMRLSKESIGALITIEQGQSLTDYIKTGTKINATVSTELLCSIFVPLTPLHDGAVIIQGNRIACASAYFPPTNADLPTKYGARHRAAIGLSEITDSTTIVISEETGTISIAERGKLTHVDEKGLRDYLMKSICVQEVEAKDTKKPNKLEKEVKGIKLNLLDEPALDNSDVMNVMKSSKKTNKIDPSFATKTPRKKKSVTAEPTKEDVSTPSPEAPNEVVENGGEADGTK